jgi:hypothetical protein
MKKFGIICIAILLTGCANIRTYEDYTDVYNPSVSISTVRVMWTDDAAAQCAKVLPGVENVIACANKNGPTCNIIARKPKNFNDHTALMLIGHEVMHCFGAKHE